MKSNEVLLHVDFSENYECKLEREIQSMHIGASEKEISLYNCVWYTGKEKVPHCFSAVSDSLDNGPTVVWAIIRPIIDDIQTQKPQLDNFYFFSDGTATQYKKRRIFNFFIKESIKTKIYNLVRTKRLWNNLHHARSISTDWKTK